MLNLKGCPKCKGDVMLDSDQYGWYEQCLQCGYIRDLPNMVEVGQQQLNKKDMEMSALRRRNNRTDTSAPDR